MKGNRALRSVFAALVAASFLLMWSCAPNHNSYSSFSTISEDGWAYADTVAFVARLEDSVASGRIAVAVRHQSDYPYANLWLEISTPDRTDTLNMRLCDREGRWLGRGMGVSFQKADTLQPLYTLCDSVPVRVRHVMRVDTLAGIEQVGIFFIPGE